MPTLESTFSGFKDACVQHVCICGYVNVTWWCSGLGVIFAIERGRPTGFDSRPFTVM